MPEPRQHATARAFRALHDATPGFVMPNAWDAGSAMVLAAEGFKAIATTSAGIAFSLGKQDYQVTDPRIGVTRAEMFARMRQIVEAVDAPVNGDLEAGYGDAPGTVAETVKMALDIGLAGGNIEDKKPLENTLYDEVLAAERIAAARAAAGRDFVLTARTDALVVSRSMEAAIRRANLYRQAGADCLFLPGASDLKTVATLLHEIDGPLNVVIGLESAKGNALELIKAGVQRISLGGTIARAALGFVRNSARELRDRGSLNFASEQMSGSELNALFAKSAAR